MKSCENQKYLYPETENEEEYLKKKGFVQMDGINVGWWKSPF